MFELTINSTVYQFAFNMGFMREINKKVGRPVDGLPDLRQNMGLQYYVAGVIDGDLESLVEILDIANKGQKPRVTKDLLDSLIDDENTDVEELFASVLDFLKSANATKKTTMGLLNELEKARAAANA